MFKRSILLTLFISVFSYESKYLRGYLPHLRTSSCKYTFEDSNQDVRKSSLFINKKKIRKFNSSS